MSKGCLIRNPKTGEVMTVIAENGNDSQLFQVLVEEYQYDRDVAGAIWAHTKTNTFKNSDIKFLVDSNGEPRIFQQLGSIRASIKGLSFVGYTSDGKYHIVPVHTTKGIGLENKVQTGDLQDDDLNSLNIITTELPITNSDVLLNSVMNMKGLSKNLRAFAELLGQLGRTADLKFPIYYSEFLEVNNDLFGYYSYQSNAVFLNRNTLGSKSKDLKAKIYLHEITHAITAYSLGLNPEFLLKVEALRAKAAEVLGEESRFSYYLTSPNSKGTEFELLTKNLEFLAGAFSDEDFQEALKEIEFAPEEGSLFDKFINLVLEALGISRGNVLAETVALVVSNTLDNKLSYNYSASHIRGRRPSTIAFSRAAVYNGENMYESDFEKREDGKYDSPNKKDITSVGEMLNSMRGRQYEDDGRTLGERKADQKWGATDPTVALYIAEFDKTLTKAEYIKLKDDTYNRGMWRGTIFHKRVHEFFSKDPKVSLEIEELLSKSGITFGEIDWITSEVIYKLVAKTGTDYIDKVHQDGEIKFIVNKRAKDRILTERTIYSPDLEVAGTIDLVIDHGDDYYSYFDVKTGHAFNRQTEYDLFQYGTGDMEDIWVNPRNKAKLQLMWYAIMTKANNPNAKFRTLRLLHLPSYFNLDATDHRGHVNVHDYLKMIKNFLEQRHPEKYAKLKALPHFESIFDPATYNAVTGSSVRVNDNNADPATELHLKILRLQQLVLWDKNIEAKAIDGNKVADTKYNQIKQLMEEIIALKGDKTINYAAWTTDMSWLDSWIGSGSSSTNPYVQLYYKIMQEQKQKASDDYRTWRDKFNALIKALAREEGISELKFGVGSLIGGVNKEKLLGWMIKTEEFDDTLVHRFITKEDAEWPPAGSIKEKLANFILDSVDQFFIDEKSQWTNPATGKKQALANKKATEQFFDGRVHDVTNLQLAKRSGHMSADIFARNKGNYFRGWMPKVPPTFEDVQKKHSFFSKPFLQYLWNKYTTNYYEAFYDGWYETDEVIPLKYLGGGEIDADNNYSLDVENIMDSFVKQHYYKQHLDEAYAFGLGLNMSLKAKEIEKGNKGISFKRTREWIDTSIEQHILGKRQQDLPLTQRAMRRRDIDTFRSVNWTKVLRSMKTYFASTTMWLKPVTGTANFIFAYLTSLKEAVKNEFGLKGQHTKFGVKDLMYGFSVARGLYGKDAMLGRATENKAYILMERYRYMPDNYDWYTSPNQLLTARNTAFTSKTMYMFHTLPEEVIATAIFVAQLKAMKTPDGLSVWDHYKQVEKIDEYGNKYKTYEWDGTVRGKVNTSKIDDIPKIEDLTELTIDEVTSIRFVYEKMHGGYRLDERTRAEYYIFGELMMQFKKYLPSILKNVGASRGLRQSQGYFKEVTDDKTGEKYLQWTPSVIEGRYRMLVGLLLHYASIKTDVFFKNGQERNKFGQWLRLQRQDEYAWESLSEVQKDDIRDFIITGLTFAMMAIGGLAMWDYDEEDSLKKLYTRIRDDLGGTVWLPEILYNVTNVTKPVAATKAHKMATSFAEVFWAGILYVAVGEEEAYTQQGNWRGSKEAQRNVPFFSAYHDLVKFFTETDDITGPDWFEQNGLKQRMK